MKNIVLRDAEVQQAWYLLSNTGQQFPASD